MILGGFFSGEKAPSTRREIQYIPISLPVCVIEIFEHEAALSKKSIRPLLWGSKGHFGIWRSHGGDFEDSNVLGYDAVWAIL
jgi:hypothetical protein